jgi:hypothetical protein
MPRPAHTEGDRVQDEPEPQVLVVAFPRRHLGPAAAVCSEAGRVTIPVGGPGDLDRTASGTEVLLIVTGEDEVSAATWHAVFERRVDPPAGVLPDGLPATWVAEHGAATVAERAVPHDEDDEDDDERVGPQSFFEARALEELPKDAWVFANELVRKQDRGGRAFLPRAPRLIRRPA